MRIMREQWDGRTIGRTGECCGGTWKDPTDNLNVNIMAANLHIFFPFFIMTYRDLMLVYS
jgi:hypothetical protein